MFFMLFPLHTVTNQIISTDNKHTAILILPPCKCPIQDIRNRTTQYKQMLVWSYVKLGLEYVLDWFIPINVVWSLKSGYSADAFGFGLLLHDALKI